MTLFLLGTTSAADLWVELPSPEAKQVAQAAHLGWAEGQEGHWYLLSTTPEIAEALGLRWRLSAVDASGWAPTPDEVAARLAALKAASIVQIGQSVRGEPLLAARFGEGPRALRILGGHHGNEGSSVEVALAVAEALDAGVAELPAGTELWIVPAVNPDGLWDRTRENAVGVDLNRNYGWQWSPDETGAGEAAFSEPEVRAIRALSRARAFDQGLSLHSGAQNIGWVWNWSRDVRAPEEALLSALAAEYAADCAAPGFWTTNGADWYETLGDATDWTFGGWGAYDFTLELTSEKSPPEEDVAGYTSWHLGAILAWVTAPPDVVGSVTDAATGESIAGWMDGSGTRLWSPDGNFARRGVGGWTVGAPGYTSAALVGPEVALVADALLPGMPTPRLLSRGGGPREVTLPGAGEGPLVLMQPGEESVEFEADGLNTWTVDPTLLAPGAWSMVTPGGVAPRALFIGEVDDRVAIEAVDLTGRTLTLRGQGFAQGSEAWSIGGTARALHPLTARSVTPDVLTFDAPVTDEDVLVWVNGAWLSIVGVYAAPVIDETPPPERTYEERVAETEPFDDTLTAVGACVSVPGARGPWLPFAALLQILLRRSMRRGASQPPATARAAS